MKDSKIMLLHLDLFLKAIENQLKGINRDGHLLKGHCVGQRLNIKECLAVGEAVRKRLPSPGKFAEFQVAWPRVTVQMERRTELVMKQRRNEEDTG